MKSTVKSLVYQGFSPFNYIMPPISGIPSPAFSSGLSAKTASVVKNIAATDATF
ncbi:hypothetical protein P9F00_17145 [Bacillus inaquosorum]|nr:hypothetical protein [Bacillus inaquosorum]MEC2065333.1 hypothetical protein [Bacillus inaquosorum]